MPIMRKTSLHRFLEKRNDRLNAKTPYQTSSDVAPVKKEPESQAWLGLGLNVIKSNLNLNGLQEETEDELAEWIKTSSVESENVSKALCEDIGKLSIHKEEARPVGQLRSGMLANLIGCCCKSDECLLVARDLGKASLSVSEPLWLLPQILIVMLRSENQFLIHRKGSLQNLKISSLATSCTKLCPTHFMCNNTRNAFCVSAGYVMINIS